MATHKLRRPPPLPQEFIARLECAIDSRNRAQVIALIDSFMDPANKPDNLDWQSPVESVYAVRTATILRQVGILVMKDLHAITEQELLEYSQIGPVILSEIKSGLWRVMDEVEATEQAEKKNTD